MAQNITAGRLLTGHCFQLIDDGVMLHETASLFSRVRRFHFGEIVAVLESPDHKFSFQAGNDVITIPIDRHNGEQLAVVETFARAVRASVFAPRG
jgi:hypothetical protein